MPPLTQSGPFSEMPMDGSNFGSIGLPVDLSTATRRPEGQQ